MRGVAETSVDRSVLVFWLVGATALVARLVAAVSLDGLEHPHVEEYDAIARNMLAGRGFSLALHGIVYYSDIAPLPAWLSAASYWLTGTLVVAMLFQIVAGAATSVAAAAVAGRLFGGWIAPLAAGMLVAFHPGLVVYSASRAHSLPFDALFLTLALLQAFRIAERPSAGRAAWLGLIVGIGVLSRATVLLFLPVAWAWLLLVRPRLSPRAAIRTLVVAGACAVAIVTPWTVRNSLLHRQFVFLVTTDGEVFWRGNNPHASGTSYIDGNRTVLSSLSADEIRDLEQQPNEVAQNEWFETRARAFIRDHPGAFLRLFVRKLFYFWWYSPTTGLLYPRPWLWTYLTYYMAALLLAAVGVWRIVRVGGSTVRLALLIGAFVSVLSAFQSLYYVEGRHRWAIEPMILAMSGGGVAALLRRRHGSAVPVRRAATSEL